MQRMNDEQRKLAADNLSLVFDYITKRHLVADIYYDVLSEILCEAAMKYDSTKQTAFSTFAYMCFDHEVANILCLKKVKKRGGGVEVLSLDVKLPKCDVEDFYELMEDPKEGPAELYLCTELLENILDCCKDDIDSRIIRGLASDLSQIEIAGYLGLSRAAVSRRVINIKNRYYTRYGGAA